MRLRAKNVRSKSAYVSETCADSKTNTARTHSISWAPQQNLEKQRVRETASLAKRRKRALHLKAVKRKCYIFQHTHLYGGGESEQHLRKTLTSGRQNKKNAKAWDAGLVWRCSQAFCLYGRQAGVKRQVQLSKKPVRRDLCQQSCPREPQLANKLGKRYLWRKNVMFSFSLHP